MSTEPQAAEPADLRALVNAHPRGIPEGPAAIHFCPVPGCLDIWESEPTCQHAALVTPDTCLDCYGGQDVCVDCPGAPEQGLPPASGTSGGDA